MVTKWQTQYKSFDSFIYFFAPPAYILKSWKFPFYLLVKGGFSSLFFSSLFLFVANKIILVVINLNITEGSFFPNKFPGIDLASLVSVIDDMPKKSKVRSFTYNCLVLKESPLCIMFVLSLDYILLRIIIRNKGNIEFSLSKWAYFSGNWNASSTLRCCRFDLPSLRWIAILKKYFSALARPTFLSSGTYSYNQNMIDFLSKSKLFPFPNQIQLCFLAKTQHGLQS